MASRGLHWLAGLLEGEGSFVPGAPCEPNLPRIVLSMADQDVIEVVAGMFGVHYIHVRNQGKYGTSWKPSYRASLKGNRAVELMCRLRPLLGQRRQLQIDRATASYKPPTRRTSALYVPEEPDSAQDLCWLAGLLEGEGSFFPGPPSRVNRPCLQLFMTDEDIVRRAASLFGVKYFSVKRYGENASRYKQPYFVALRGQRATELMRQLYGLMGKRRKEQIERALASYKPLDRRRHTARLSDEQVMEIYRRSQSGERQWLIAADFGIDRTTVADIKRGKSWSWLTRSAADPNEVEKTASSLTKLEVEGV
jgi:hypothetical protein